MARRVLNFSEADLQRMENLYRWGFNTKDIAEDFGCLPGSVRQKLLDRGVPFRKNGQRPPRKLHMSHGYQIYDGRAVHRIVAEAWLGRPLNAMEVVHHIDGNPCNNHPENLKVCPSNSIHMREHELWTPRMDAVLTAGRESGLIAAEIAVVLGVTKASVDNRARILTQRGKLKKFSPGHKRSRSHWAKWKALEI